MIDKFVEIWNKHNHEITFEEHPEYRQLVAEVINLLDRHTDKYTKYNVDSKRIIEIDHGDYQGCLLYVIAEKGYQPHGYYYVKVDYGSCSGCDTLESIRDDYPESKRLDQYKILCLHIIQGLKKMEEE